MSSIAYIDYIFTVSPGQMEEVGEREWKEEKKMYENQDGIQKDPIHNE